MNDAIRLRPAIRLSRALCDWDTAPAWPDGFSPYPFDASQHGAAARTLLNAAYSHGEGDIQPFTDWWHSISTDSEFDSALLFPVIHTRSGRMAAFAHAWNSGFIKDIAVDREWRGRGLGRALIHQAASVMRSRGLSEISLKVVATNTAARAFYARLGFAENSPPPQGET